MTNSHRLVGAAVAAVAASYGIVAVLDANTFDRLTAEDHLIENLGALLFMAASVLFAASTVLVCQSDRAAGGRPRRLSPAILLTCGLLWVALEEISYGQRVLGFRAPEVFQKLNTQKEFNFHNLIFWSGEEGLAHWFNVQRLFSVFWLIYCTIFPVAHLLTGSLKSLCRAVYLPVAPIGLGAAFLFNYAAAKGMVLWMTPPALMGAVTELKETNYALLFACFGLVEFAFHQENHTWP